MPKTKREKNQEKIVKKGVTEIIKGIDKSLGKNWDRLKDHDYKKLYFDLKEQFDRFVKHKKSHNRQCKQCREFYRETIANTKQIKNKGLRESLLRLWDTMWINGCNDFDIILYELDWEKIKGR